MIRQEVIEHKICDLCGQEVDKLHRKLKYPVIFTTEQNEGTPCAPYIENTELDICEKCAEKVLKIKAQGAQGYNTYTLKE